MDRLVIGHININSLRNKFDSLKILVKNSLDIFYDIKLDETFPEGQFFIDEFTPPYRMDGNTKEVVQRFMLEKIYHPDKKSFKNDDKATEHLFVEKEKVTNSMFI